MAEELEQVSGEMTSPAQESAGPVNPPKLTPQEFAAKVREKYPKAYDKVDDVVLSQKFIEKYPAYESKVDFGQPAKPTAQPVGKQQAVGQSGVSASPSATMGKSSSVFGQPEVGVIPSGAVPKKDVSEKETAYIKPVDKEARLKSMASDIDKINKAKNPKEQRGYFENLWDNFEADVVNVDTMLASIPETVYNIAAIPYNLMTKLTGTEETSAEKVKGKLGVSNPILDHYLEESKRLKEKTAEFEQKQYETQGIWANVEKGNYQDAFEQLGTGLARSAPTSIAMMMGGAATSLPKLMLGSTVAMTGTNRQELEESHPQASELEKTVKALGLAGAETVFGAISDGTLGKVYKDILLKEGEAAAKVTFKEGLVKMYETALKKYGAKAAALGGGIEEVATQVTQNMINGRPAMEGVPDAFIQGVAGEGAYAAPINVMQIANKFKVAGQERQINKVLESDTNKYNTIQDVFKPSEPTTGTDLTADKLKVVQMKGASEMLTKSLDKSVEKGEITEEQAQLTKKDFLETADSVSKTAAIPFSDESRLKAVNLIRQKETLKREVANMDEALAIPKKEQIKAIDEQLLNLANEATKKPTESVETKAEGKEEGVEPTSETTSKESVREEVKPVEEVEKSPIENLMNKRVTFTDPISGDVKEGDLYTIGQTVVAESDGHITDLGNIDDFKDLTLEDLPVTEVEPTVKTGESGELIYNGKDEAIQKGVITPIGEGLKAIKRNNKGQVTRVVVTDENGNTHSIKGQEATDLAYTMMLDNFNKGGKNKIGNNEAITNRITTEYNRNVSKSTKGKTDGDIAGAKPRGDVSGRGEGAVEAKPAEAKKPTKAKEKPAEAKPTEAEKKATESIKKKEATERTEKEQEVVSDVKAKQDYKEKAKTAADKIRSLKANKTVKDAMSKLSANALFEVAWDGALETTAVTVELTGDLAQAMYDGLTHLRNSDWYQSLSDPSKMKAERMFQEDINRAYGEANENTSFGDTFKTGFENFKQYTIQKFFDKYSSVRKFINKEYSGRKSDKTDFSQAEILSHGKASNDIEKLDKELDAIYNKMFAKGLTTEDVSDYMYARHAGERNKHIKENVDPENEFGSGMTSQRAKEILEETYTQEQLRDLEEVAQDFYKVINGTRDFMKEKGLLSDEQYNNLKDYYERYVPLTGFDNPDIEQSTGIEGNAFDVQGNLIKRAAGRSTKAGNVIEGIIRQRVAMIMKGHKNEVLHTLYENALEHPDNKAMQLFDKTSLPKTLSVNADGTVVNRADDTRRDEYVGVKVDGEQFFLKFANKEFGKVLNAANVEKSSLLGRGFRKYMRFLSSSMTTYNPVFVATNLVKDTETAVYNILAETDLNPNFDKSKLNGMTRRTLSNLPKSIAAIYANERSGKVDTEMTKWYNEFKEEGAKTGWAQQRTPEELRRSIENHFKALSSKRLSPRGVLEGGRAASKFIEDVNTSVENGVRLSTYIECRKAGLTKPQAARVAKELTINFNKSGEMGPAINSLFMFFNAGAQGTARMYKAMSSLKKTTMPDGTVKRSLNRGQKLAIATAATAALLTWFNQSISDDDDDGLSFYEKIPDSIKERNLIIMNPADGKTYFKIPLQYGYNIFANFGTTFTETVTGERSLGDAAGFLTMATIGAFSPVSLGQGEGVSGKVLPAIIPTVLKPVFEVYQNENFMGQQIYNEPFQGQKPAPSFTRARRTTPKVAVEISKWLNDITGGNEKEIGKADWNPESLYHVFKANVGGTGRFVTDVAETGSSLISGKEVEAAKVPFGSKFYAEPNEYVDQTMFKERLGKIQQKVEAVNAKVADEDDMDIRGKIKSVGTKYEDTEKQVKKFRKEKKAAEDIKDEDRRQAKIDKIDEQIFKLYKRANKFYNDKLGKNY